MMNNQPIASSSRARRVPFLDYIRAIAAIIVLLSHLVTKIEGFPQPSALMILINWGTESVVLFFLLAGFVTRLSQERKPEQKFSDFMTNRVVRIYPIFLMALLVALLVFYGLEGTPSWRLVLGNLVFMHDLQGHWVDVIKTNPALWSLSYEALFSCLFALTLIHPNFFKGWLAFAGISFLLYDFSYDLGWLRHYHDQLAFSLIWLLGYGIAKYRYAIKFSQPFAWACFASALGVSRIHFIDNFFDIYRLTGFALLCLPLFNAFNSQSTVAVSRKTEMALACFTSSLTVLLLATLSNSNVLTKMVLASLSLSGVLLCLLCRSPKMEGFNKILRSFSWLDPVLVYVASISYALYALHMPIIFLLDHALGTALKLSPFVVFVGAVILSFIAAHVCELVVQPKITAQYKLMKQKVV